MSAGEHEDGSASKSRSEEDLQSERSEQERSDSPTASSVFLESHKSVSLPLDFRDEAQRNTERNEQDESNSPTASHQSLKSDKSVSLPLDFSDEAQRNAESELSEQVSPEQVKSRPDQEVCQRHHKALEVFCKTDKMHICNICAEQEHREHRKHYRLASVVPDSQPLFLYVMENMGTENFKNFKRELTKDYPGCLGSESEELGVSNAAEKIVESFGGEAALRLILYFKANVNPLQQITEANKANLNKKCQNINEGNSSQGKQSSLRENYTDLYVADGGSGEINNEHEVLRIEVISQSRTTQETPYACNDIFKTLPGQRKQIRTVLMMGIAGIGKTVLVHKFILDWVDGKANQDIQVIVHLPFRDLNQKKENCSLLQLIHQYAPELKEADPQKMKVLFILDGLEVCQYPLDFHNNDYCTDINEEVPVDVLLTNLIRGNLLWITTRPSTASRIPPECVHRVTEIRGFNNHQKETYFRKRITDLKLVNEIITHIKSCQSLYIMCHMPIFCWISATVLENVMSNGNSCEVPRTLTEMFTHFLLIQISLKHKKFNGADADNPKKLSKFDKILILKLAKLAFQQLEKGSCIFQGEDLIKSGIDVSKVLEYSVFTEMFREELGLYREKVYSFVHLSYQEYLAAVYAHFACVNDGKNVLVKDKSTNLSDVHQSAVDKALKSETGHLDLFLRFLLGLSVDPNFTLLQDILTKGSSGKHCVDKNMTVHFIQEKIKQEHSPERIINLFHCLTELNDNSLVKEIQTAMKSGTLLGSELEPEQWSALAYVLLKSGEELDEFDMKFHTSIANQLRLLPVLKICKKARLNCCNLSSELCGRVASALQSINSPLRELDLCNNKLDKSGMSILLSGLTSPRCQLNRLRLAGCHFPSTSCKHLASALKSMNSSLTELDLSYSKIGDYGMIKLCNGLISPHCKLHKLKLKRCGLTDACCVNLASVLKSSYSQLKELELKSNDLQDSGVKQLSVGLQDPQCTIERLGLSGCMITEVGCNYLATALSSNTGHLIELDLSYNHPGDVGVKLLSAKKEDPNCKLEKLHVDNGGGCRMKPDLRKYTCQLSVDQSTVHRRLKLSEGNRIISETRVEQKYPDHPHRFRLYPQVMCEEPLTDRCYFEVEYDGGVGVAVAYKTSDRTQNIMGVRNPFPALLCLDGKLKLWQNNEITCVFPVFAWSTRVGVYADLEHGSLSYYSICNDTLIHLYTHHTTFTGTLYTGFIFLPDSSVTLGEIA